MYIVFSPSVLEFNGSKYQASSAVCQCRGCASHRQALEKNQQWLVYDQQREAYVQSVLARSVELEQQLAQAKQQQSKQEAGSDGERLTCMNENKQNLYIAVF